MKSSRVISPNCHPQTYLHVAKAHEILYRDVFFFTSVKVMTFFLG